MTTEEREQKIDEVFSEKLRAGIAALNDHRNNRPDPPVGQRHKKTMIDILREDGQFSHKYFLTEFPAIANKTSKIPAKKRNYIMNMCMNAMRSAVVEVQKSEKL